MNSERFYSQNNTTNIIQDFIKKGSLTCNLSCLWKVSCCHFSGVAPLPTDNDFLVLWFFLAAFLQHCWSSTKRTGAGAGSGQTTALCLGADWHCFPSRTVVNLRKHVTCTIIMTCNVGYLWDTLRASLTQQNRHGSLQVDADHLFCTTGHPGVPPAWLAGRWEWPPGQRKWQSPWHHQRIRDMKMILLWRHSTALSLTLSFPLSLSMYNIVQLQSIIYSII